MIKEFFIDNWKSLIMGISIAVILIFLFELYIRLKKHRHKWKYLGYTVLENKYPRLIKKCEKCDVAVHLPVYSRKQLKKIEEGK